MENGSIPNDSIKASSELDEHHGATRARLNTKPEGDLMGAWVPLESDDSQWLEVDLGKVVEITKVGTQGGGEGVEHCVTSYILLFSEDQENFQEYKENDETKVNVVLILCLSRVYHQRYVQQQLIIPPFPPIQETHVAKAHIFSLSQYRVWFPGFFPLLCFTETCIINV